MKNVEYKIKVTETGAELTVKNDGHHFRAFDKEGLQKSNPWIKLESLLDEVGAEIVGEQGNGAPASPAAHPELDKMKAVLEKAGESYDDNLAEFKGTYKKFPEDARAMVEAIGCDYEKLVKEVEALPAE